MAKASSIHCRTLADYNMAKYSRINLHPVEPDLEWHASPVPVGGSVQPALKYNDRYLGKPTMRILFSQRAQVDAPLHVIEAAAARLHLPRGYAVKREQARLPSAYMRVSLWPAQLQRAAIGFTMAVSNALAASPANVYVSASRLQTRILLRVMSGYVAKIQVCARSLARCDCGRASLFDERCSKLWRIAGLYVQCIPLPIARLRAPMQRTALHPAFASSSLPPLLQAAAAARIAGKVIAGEVRLQHKGYGLVSDLLIADAAFVHQRDSSCVARSFFCSPYAVDNIRYTPASF